MIISDVTYQTKAGGKLGPILPTFQVIILLLYYYYKYYCY